MVKVKKINIFGAGITARDFILQSKEIEIQCFIESINYENRKFMEGYFPSEIPILTPEHAEGYLRKYYTVVASRPHIYKEIKNLLEGFGLIEYENFEYYKTFGKKITLIYGNCHMLALSSVLETSPEFSDIYGIYPMKPIQDIVHEGGLHTVNYDHVLQNCNLFIHQCVRRENYFGEEYASEEFIRKLPKKCRIIGVPNLYRMPWCLFPQIPSYDSGIIWEGQRFFYLDSYIDKNYMGGLSVDEQCKVMEDKFLISKAEIAGRYDEFLRKVYQKEKQWDVKIGTFIEDNIKKHKLFYDPGHPTGHVVRYIAESVLKILFGELKKYRLTRGWELDIYEVFTYASVDFALGFEYPQDAIRQYNGMKLRNVYMDRREYVKQYLMWNHGGIC